MNTPWPLPYKTTKHVAAGLILGKPRSPQTSVRDQAQTQEVLEMFRFRSSKGKQRVAEVLLLPFES